MKIISWNVNGMAAALDHGLAEFVRRSDADLYAFQETKLSERVKDVFPRGYLDFWSFNTSQKGYSGVCCLARHAPVRVYRDLCCEGFDCEGRVLALEFEKFFFVNCYTPNSQHGPGRFDYRCQWDGLFLDFAKELLKRKAVIICGDFNVPASVEDIFAEHKQHTKEGYVPAERENMQALLRAGFLDSYRELHPDEKDAFTWWSSRQNKRANNQGWRLDYALVSRDLEEGIQRSEILSGVTGSDHCPISLSVNISRLDRDVDTESRTVRIGAVTFARPSSAEAWDNINWEEARTVLASLQKGLSQEAAARNPKGIMHYQKKIASLKAARYLAVRRVCSTAGGPGPDGVVWRTAKEKMAAAMALTPFGYRSQPYRLMIVKTPQGKERRIQLPTWHDRAMQVLYSFTLDPVAEAWADTGSYAFRKGRSALDINVAILRAFSGINAPQWAFIGDIRQCYETISHQWILDNIPTNPCVMRQFLKAGFLFDGCLFPADMGVGIGWSISPIIANMTLDGLQDYILKGMEERRRPARRNGVLLRYADDIIVSAASEDEALEIQEIVREFVTQRGLELSPVKSRVINVGESFDFLSRTYEKRSLHLVSSPSKESMSRIMEALKETVEGHNGSQSTLIEKLNQKIGGWANYHRTGNAHSAFRRIDVYLKALLMRSCRDRHPGWSREKILQRYWFLRHDGRYAYALPMNKEVQVKFLSEVPIIHHQPVKPDINPYIDDEYLAQRVKEREIRSVTGPYRAVWERQRGLCRHCGQPLLRDQDKELVPFDGAQAYVHSRCRDLPMDFRDAGFAPSSADEVEELLQTLAHPVQPISEKFLELAEFFRTSIRPSVKLTFQEMEEIMGAPLGKLQNTSAFWQNSGPGSISRAWSENGYEVKRFHLKEKYIVFHKTKKNSGILKIPRSILSGNIPDAARYEIENYLAYIVKKYGL